MGNGLIQYRGSEGNGYMRVGIATTSNGLISDNVRSVFEDVEGNLWLGMYGEGLLRYVDNSLRFYHYHGETESDRAYAIAGDNSGLYAVVGDRLLRLNQSGDKVLISVPIPGNQGGDLVNTAYLGEDGRLWLGFEKSGLYVFGPSGIKDVFISNDDLANSVNHITGKDGNIWVGTKKGICRISGETGLAGWFTTDHGLPHNNIQQLYIDSKGRVLVATLCREIHYINDNGEVARLENSGLGHLNSVMSISEERDGTIWAGTQGNGVWKIVEGDNVNYTKTSGLLSDFCYSLTHTGQGVLVVGHRGGISQIDTESERIRTFSQLEGINSSAELYPNAVFRDNSGNIWFGTSEGLVRYSSSLSAGGMLAPRLQIGALYVDGEQVDHSAGQVLLKPGYYELAMEYIGIHLTNPEMVIYQTKLEGYNKNWSDLSSGRRVVYDRVGHGNYTFRIKAFNESDIGSEISTGIELRIKKPMYLTIWFYTAIFFVISFLVYLIIRLRERNQIRFQISLQKQLDERTHEVVIQKEEIEIKNKDITDSINYAQKIQASILPPVSKLQEKFTGAFVFYQPKDIVSGDFYWYGNFKDDIFVIACADSTGHGVPGAFMSMIGTTLLKDIGSKISVDSPSKLLSNLDKEIRTVLSQNLEDGGSNDGMDISIAEINLESYKLSTASAMRPMMIYQNGEPIYVSGNRFSTGGQYEFEEKTFDTKEFPLTKGDKIYMYTDGYADQFGGPDCKKFKSGNVKNLLQEIHEKPMDEQHHFIKRTFDSWKGDMGQVDDVLFMGIEI
jgi:serine phosphatase RsbU (regulator of sigma subunit)/streptogramin lyase